MSKQFNNKPTGDKDLQKNTPTSPEQLQDLISMFRDLAEKIEQAKQNLPVMMIENQEEALRYMSKPLSEYRTGLFDKTSRILSELIAALTLILENDPALLSEYSLNIYQKFRLCSVTPNYKHPDFSTNPNRVIADHVTLQLDSELIAEFYDFCNGFLNHSKLIADLNLEITNWSEVMNVISDAIFGSHDFTGDRLTGILVQFESVGLNQDRARDLTQALAGFYSRMAQLSYSSTASTSNDLTTNIITQRISGVISNLSLAIEIHAEGDEPDYDFMKDL